MVCGRLPSLDIEIVDNIDIHCRYLDTHPAPAPAPAPRLAAHRAVLGVVRHGEAGAGLVLGAETWHTIISPGDTGPGVVGSSVPLLEWCDMLCGSV